MNRGIINTAARSQEPEERRFYGVAIAIVKSVTDLETKGQVQLRFPWISGFEPWARIAAMVAGNNAGAFFIPQVDDEVLVAFAHGDIREPYVIGGLWNGEDSPPTTGLLDPIHKRMIKTPKELEFTFDDLQESITIKNKDGHEISIDKQRILISIDQSSIELKKNGVINIESDTEINLKSAKVKIEADNLELKSNATTRVNGGRSCDIQANMVRIN